MEIREASEVDKQQWNEFVSNHFPSVGSFLQSWEWGEFQNALGYSTKRIIITHNGDWQGVTLAVKNKLPFGLSYYYLPRGPVLLRSVWENEHEAEKALQLIRKILSNDDKKNIFIRMEPAIENPPKVLLKKPFVLPRTYVQPRFNAVVGIAKPSEEVMRGFSPDMRNSIRKAERNNVSVKIKTELNETEWLEFRNMRLETSTRAGKNIYPSEKYFRELIRHLPVTIFAAYHDGTLSGITIVVFFSQTATYLFGASRTDKLIMKISPHLNWIAIRESQNRGLGYYDLGGVDERAWPTLTHFKRQFGGNVITYMGNVDDILQKPAYKIYQFLHTIRR